MTGNGVRDDDSVQVAARNVLMGAAPERHADLDDMWQELDPRFQVAPDIHEGQRIIMDAGADRYVRFNNRVLRAFWIAAYAAWEGYRAVAEAVSLDAVNLSRFRELIVAFEATISSDNPELEALPNGVAEPGQYPDRLRDVQGRAASEFATIAVAWVFCTNYGISATSAKGPRPIPLARKSRRSITKSCLATLSPHRFCWSGSMPMPAAQGSQLSWSGRSGSSEFISAYSPSRCWRRTSGAISATHPAVQTRINAVRALMTPQSNMGAAIAHVAFAALGKSGLALQSRHDVQWLADGKRYRSNSRRFYAFLANVANNTKFIAEKQ